MDLKVKLLEEAQKLETKAGKLRQAAKLLNGGTRTRRARGHRQKCAACKRGYVAKRATSPKAPVHHLLSRAHQAISDEAQENLAKIEKHVAEGPIDWEQIEKAVGHPFCPKEREALAPMPRNIDRVTGKPWAGDIE
jgi:hypothetical protein